MTISSETSPPLAMMSFALRPIGVAGCNRSPQHVAGRELDDAVFLNETLRLGSLACPRWPEKDQPHLRRPFSFERLIRPSY